MIIPPSLEASQLRRRVLTYQTRKAIPIKSYTPRFEKNYSLDRKYDVDRDRAEANKLRKEYKDEMKGAIKELRKDAAFIARAKLQKTKQESKDYKRKMDKIVGQLADQQADYHQYQKAMGKKIKKF